MCKNYQPTVFHQMRPDSFSHERRDCTVRAISNATKLPYEDAHEILRKWGRKQKRGVFFNKFIGNYRIINGVRITPSNMFNGLTLNKLYEEPAFIMSSWIVMVNGHVFYVNKGDVYDQGLTGGRTKVKRVFKIG